MTPAKMVGKARFALAAF